MDILFNTNKLAKLFNEQAKLVKKYGPQQALLIRRRMDDLRATATLADLGHLPPARCHELTGDRAGQLSVDLRHPYRLIFVPDHEPIPLKEDGGLDWAQVTCIRIIGVEDTHG